MNNYIFTSSRLGFRNWLTKDEPHFSEMSCDKDVREYFPTLLSYEESLNSIESFKSHYDEHGFTIYAVDELVSSEFIGYIGFKKFKLDMLKEECVEIGWGLARRFWNKGYATEGAIRCVEYGFQQLGFKKIYSFTSPLNKRSENVMKRIGMVKIGEFNHPRVTEGHILQKHVLYMIKRSD